MTEKGIRARQREATREQLLQTARAVFTDVGYADASIDAIVGAAGVAKGSLYHHFSNKEAIFRAVFDEVEGEAIERIATATLSADEAWTGVRAGLGEFLDACLEPSFRRIVVIDGPTVRQHDSVDDALEMRELPILRTAMGPLTGIDGPGGRALEPLAHMALGGLYGAALYLSRAQDPTQARAEVNDVLDALVDGLRGSLG